MFRIAWIIVDEDGVTKLTHYEPEEHIYYSGVYKVTKVVYSEIKDD